MWTKNYSLERVIEWSAAVSRKACPRVRCDTGENVKVRICCMSIAAEWSCF